jgi:hypothetical protein
VVEMALLSILLFLLVAGIVDIGRVLFANIGLQEAAQEGAIYGSFNPDPVEIEKRVLSAVEYPPIDEPIAITCTENIAPQTDEISVRVTHTVDLITPIVGQWFGGAITLERTVTGRVFKVPPAFAGCTP